MPPSTRPTAPLAARIARGLVGGVALLSAAMLLLPTLPVDSWFIRGLEFPRLQVSLSCLVASTALLFLGRDPWHRWLAGAALLTSGWSLYRVSPYLLPGSGMPFTPCDGQVDVMVANLQYDNRNSDALFAAVDEAAPDLLLLLESDGWWDQELTTLDQDFPTHSQTKAATQYYGMHLLSRSRIDVEVRYPVPNDVPVMDGRLTGGARFLALHPRPPHVGETAEWRDKQLLKAAEALTDEGSAVIVMGDFNTVPWEHIYQRLLSDADLIDPRTELGRLSTYRLWGLPAWPLDHILWRDGLELQGYRLGPDIGSDHLPVLARLCPTDAGSTSR